MLQTSTTLREFAMSPPWHPVPTVGDHTGEEYLIHPFSDVQRRYAQGDFFAKLSPNPRPHEVAPKGGTWLSCPNTVVCIADTLFTRGSERGNLNHPRSVILLASSPVFELAKGNKLWVYSVKLKSEGAGHFSKNWPLAEACMLERRDLWKELGILG